MPRRARKKSNTGIYHVMLRGINRQDIFHDAEDKYKFLLTLTKYKETCGCQIYGYCLMSNHIHLLLREGRETLAQIMKRIGTSYVYWYNMKYERCGHLFQDRFRSEIIEDDRHLLAVLRYIHQNPLKAGMVEALAAYKWSSYHEYIKQEGMVTDPKFALNYFHSEPNKALEIFKRFMEQENRDSFLEAEVIKKKIITDEQARTIIKQMTGLDTPQELQLMNKKERDAVIRKLRAEQLSIRQLARLTGIGRRIIEKAAFYS